eukprot:gene7208-8590_t
MEYILKVESSVSTIQIKVGVLDAAANRAFILLASEHHSHWKVQELQVLIGNTEAHDLMAGSPREVPQRHSPQRHSRRLLDALEAHTTWTDCISTPSTCSDLTIENDATVTGKIPTSLGTLTALNNL